MKKLLLIGLMLSSLSLNAVKNDCKFCDFCREESEESMFVSMELRVTSMNQLENHAKAQLPGSFGLARITDLELIIANQAEQEKLFSLIPRLSNLKNLCLGWAYEVPSDDATVEIFRQFVASLPEKLKTLKFKGAINAFNPRISDVILFGIPHDRLPTLSLSFETKTESCGTTINFRDLM